MENKKGRFVNLYRILHNKPTGGIRQCKKLCKKCRTPPECKQVRNNHPTNIGATMQSHADGYATSGD